MPDIIKLLPDSIANQIAAGEVIQRPASALKELMENAVDAKATSIKVIVKEAGKTFLQVIDNGIGMSETDARMSFERHATSKLSSAEELFSIKTKGFRGEALASIAAVAQVELKTRLQAKETGTEIIIEGSEVISQQPCAVTNGTSIAIKNLFYNVPARRNFLKSTPVEFRHILEEFQRVALPHPEIAFTLHHNGLEIFNLPTGNLRQRICAVFGSNYNERLVPVEENTTVVNITGFVGKPEFAKKVRGEQYFFINNRYVRDGYLNHAVSNAFEELLPNGSFPSYFLMLEIDPSRIDINIHPTKTEIKFEDEKPIYAILRAAVKRAMGKFSIAPTLDFEQEQSFNIPIFKGDRIPVQPTIKVNPHYNPFKEEKQPQGTTLNTSIKTDWQQRIVEKIKPEENFPQKQEVIAPFSYAVQHLHFFEQVYNSYILTYHYNQLVVIDQQAAHEQVLYEKNMAQLQNSSAVSQQELFPVMLELSTQSFHSLQQIADSLKTYGFDIREFGKNAFVLHATPAYVEKGKEKWLLEKLVEDFDSGATIDKKQLLEKTARSLAQIASVKAGQALTHKEMKTLCDNLFECQSHSYTYNGKAIIVSLSKEELVKRFEKK